MHKLRKMAFGERLRVRLTLRRKQRLLLKEWLPPAVLLVLWVVLVLSLQGCARLKIEQCIIDGDTSRRAMDCSHPDRPQGYTVTAESGDGYPCSSPGDYERLLKACQEQRPAQVTICLISGSEYALDCFAPSDPVGDGFRLQWAEAAGYICTNLKDYERLLKFCFR